VTLRETLHAEWTKVRTIPATPWLVLATVVLTITVGVAATAMVSCPNGCTLDPARTSLTGVALAQSAVAILAVLVVSGEYGAGMSHVTFTAMPSRATVLAAKAVVVSGLTCAAGVVAVTVSIVVGRVTLPAFSLTGAVLRAGVGSVLYLVLIGLLSLGVATAVRDAAPAVGIVLALLYLFPIVAHFGDQLWYRHVEQVGPMTAGLAVQVTVDIAAQPIAPWIGLGVLSAWGAGALLAGGLLLTFRDA
jgi:ABC-2 type transport system permease protein